MNSWLSLLPHYGSYKDYWRLATMINDSIESSYFVNRIIKLYGEALEKDCEKAFGMSLLEYRSEVSNGRRPKIITNKGISLAAKYAPKANGKYKKYFGDLIRQLFFNEKTYRWMCADLRSIINLVEVSMSDNKWSEINYSNVPSLALKRYLKAFKRHSPDQFNLYMSQVHSGEKKACVKQVYPHEFVSSIRRGINVEENSVLLEEYIRQMNDVFTETACVIDTSASMTSQIKGNNYTAIDVAISLGLLVGWSCTSPLEHKYIQFSSRSEIVHIHGETWEERIKNVYKNSIVENTNLQAVANHLIADRIVVKYLLIVSDMQFDQATEIWKSVV